jgi:catechol 2,3-dioxygenase-like lactoylglutathione lyase family enzyme
LTDAQSLTGPDAAAHATTQTIHQVASIVKDLDASVARIQNVMGWAPWDVYEYAPGRLRELTVRGQPAEFTWIGAEVAIGPEMYVELLQPTSANGIFHEWLTAHGEGMHHVGYWAPSVEEAQGLMQELTADGTEVLLSAWIDDVWFYYLDTHPMIYEVWAGDLDSLAAVRQIGALADS